ncbi:hypothetical protein N9B94_02045 [Verrucomicrobia bacterium]|nr:hypothetical protein [Verrucomicrobiota bacterium]
MKIPIGFQIQAHSHVHLIERLVMQGYHGVSLSAGMTLSASWATGMSPLPVLGIS